MAVPKQLLTNSSEEELEAMVAEIEKELRRREIQREEDERRRENEVDPLGGGKGGYQWEMVKCRKSCQCNNGAGHGPYLYRYFRGKNGKMASEYIGVKGLDSHPLAPPRPAPEDARQIKPLEEKVEEAVVS